MACSITCIEVALLLDQCENALPLESCLINVRMLSLWTSQSTNVCTVQALPGFGSLDVDCCQDNTEQSSSTTSKSLRAGPRPDLLICVENATVYVGEDKARNLTIPMNTCTQSYLH